MKKHCDVLDRNIIITIDGPSASGKSTVAREVAKKLGFEHLDTGAIYRAIAVWCDENGWNENDFKTFVPRLGEIKYVVDVTKNRTLYKLNNNIINNKIRSPQISQLASKVATIQEVRNYATEIQRKIADQKSIVVEGRDAGKVVFVKASVKIYLIASLDERAKRRLTELKLKNPEKSDDFTLEDTKKELQERDKRDREREHSPMQRAVDAQSIDTTGLNITQVVNMIVKIAKSRRPRKPNIVWKWLMGDRRAQTNLVYKLSFLLTTVIYKVFYRLKVYGLENFPLDDDCATIVAPNHSSFLDPPAAGISCPCEMHALGIDYLFKAPIIGWFLPRMNVHPVANDVTDSKIIRMIVSLLKEGRNVLIFPEGARSPDNQLLPFKRGVTVLAALTKCSITPTYIDGAYESWKRGNLFPKPWGKISIVYGKPLYWKDYESRFPSKREAEREMLKDLKDRIQEMKDTFKRT